MLSVPLRTLLPVNDDVISEVRAWVREQVVGWNLCPFARRELVNETIRFRVSEAEDEEALLLALAEEIQFLDRQSDVETTLLIHPRILSRFDDYNEFLGLAEALLADMEREGVYQIASFHPQYQFAGTQPDDPENYTNRSPYPLLHLLREDSLSDAVDNHPDVQQIPVDNIALMNRMGVEKLRRAFPWTS